MIKKFNKLEMDEKTICFGFATHPLTRNNVTLGDGKVVPEINFTLPQISVTKDHIDEIKSQYKSMITEICSRTVELNYTEIVVEFELLPQMTFMPKWGAEITKILRDVLDEYKVKNKLNSLLRITPVDIRESQIPPLKRTGKELDNLLKSFQLCAEAGADLLSIESTGGKEVTDKAITEGDIKGIILGAGILGSNDMEFLWGKIYDIAKDTNTISAGDTACGIGNTAMILADKKFISKVFASVVRTITAVRSLVAYEMGAVGPGKDCGYENPILKAVTGYPMSMEGKSAACAHLSALGNIAAAYADLWSNESVQNVKLLSAMAPVVSIEQLIYDCRLFNISISKNKNIELRNWLIESDISFDPQAYIFKPEFIIEIAKIIISEENHYNRSIKTALKTIELLKKAVNNNALKLPEREIHWMNIIENDLHSLPQDVDKFIATENNKWKEYLDLKQYGYNKI